MSITVEELQAALNVLEALYFASGYELQRKIRVLEEQVAKLKGHLKVLGAEVNEAGDLEIDMEKYNEVHRTGVLPAGKYKKGEKVDLMYECPFCGSIKVSVYESPGEGFSRRGYHVLCHNRRCWARGPVRGTKHGAIQAWNRRGCK